MVSGVYLSDSLVRVVVLFVIAVVSSVALRQYLVLHGVTVNSGGVLLFAAVPVQAQDVLEGRPHVFVPEAVDDGIDEGVALGQHQAVLLVAQHLALVAAQTVQQQHHQAGRPAEHKAACRGKDREGGEGRKRVCEVIRKVVTTLEINKKSPR